jgi:hypothetical protein
MSSSSDFELIHGQLHVTKDPTKPEALGKQVRSIGGSAYLQGPVQFGNDKTFHPKEVPPFTAPIPEPEATVMIGPLKNTDSPLPSVCDDSKFISKWEISPCGTTGTGAEKYGVDLANPYSLVVRAGAHITRDQQCGSEGIKDPKGPAAAMFIGDVDLYGYTRVKDKLSVVGKADFNQDIVIRQDVIVKGNIVLGGSLIAAGGVVQSCSLKPFNIKHPDKEGWRLVHNSLEGPEVSVFFRGRVKNSTEIHLPTYWKNLVDTDTITVNLTPIGAHQDVIVKRWDDRKVYLQSKGGMPIDCFYYIVAERKDIDKLVVEYEGSFEDMTKIMNFDPTT